MYVVNIPSLLKEEKDIQAGIQESSKILEQLADYTVYHFGFEEEIFDTYDCADKEEHKKYHRPFVKKVVDFQNDLKAGKAGLSMDLMLFLTNWLKDHILIMDILIMDKAYSRLLKIKYKTHSILVFTSRFIWEVAFSDESSGEMLQR